MGGEVYAELGVLEELPLGLHRAHFYVVGVFGGVGRDMGDLGEELGHYLVLGV